MEKTSCVPPGSAGAATEREPAYGAGEEGTDGNNVLEPPVPAHLDVGDPVEEVREAEEETRAESCVGEVDGREKDGAAFAPGQLSSLRVGERNTLAKVEVAPGLRGGGSGVRRPGQGNGDAQDPRVHDDNATAQEDPDADNGSGICEGGSARRLSTAGVELSSRILGAACEKGKGESAPSRRSHEPLQWGAGGAR